MKTLEQIIKELPIKEIIAETINHQDFKKNLANIAIDCVVKQIEENSREMIEKEIKKSLKTK